MFRSEALRTRYIIRSEEPWPGDVHGSRHGSHIGKALARAAANQAAADGDLLNASLKAGYSPQEKPHASTVDRRVSLTDSLKAGREMAARTNGMGLAKSETKIVRNLKG